MLVISHGDERPVVGMFQTVNFLLEHHVDDYDWFFLVQDDVYTQPDRLKALVDHLSMRRELYMGHPEEFIGGEGQGRFCSGKAGYLLSRALLLKIKPFLDHCRNDIVSVRPDEWLGRCIIDYTSTNCMDELEVRERDPCVHCVISLVVH